MGFGIARTARSSKPKSGVRALFGRAPEAAEVGDRLVRLAKRLLRDAIIDASPRRITFSLHAAASPARIIVLPSGDLEITAETSSLGPGYHAEILSRLAPILDELDYAWADADAPDPRPAMAAWLADQLRAGATRIGMPADRHFLIDGAVVQTAMGPRDAAWRDAAIADPERAGADAFPWWHTGAGQRARASALHAMWHEVPWRAPLDDAEAKLMARVDADLRAADAADPALELPWAEWIELREALELDADDLRARTSASSNAKPAIGYRRYLMDVELANGWSVHLPGNFLGAWDETDTGTRYVATDGERSIEFVPIEVADARPSPELLAIAPERFPVVERTATSRAEQNGDVLHGLVADAPHVAILTCTGPLEWALATWRSLTREPTARRGE